ncbi:MAG: DNA polymerase III subunit gamma/tau [Desulfobacterales bacterium]|nr:DNA polymerase III subunit gamma/tau [Desulfobacterales bacterium]
MSYQVLALKYRPQTFDEVVGQAHVTATLSNAIQSGRVAHAILFTGPRGTGKTTIARILAKAMNCRKGPAPVPCNACKLCTDIIDGHCPDVFEIDGASNNSVDQIRDLRENVIYMPSSAAYKIYIIDEVHMLSTAAFNALLKTLEEPPDHVMFIFATTEVHKIPATILSRCQRHDLGRVSLPDIAGHLDRLSRQEGFCLEARSLDLIARQADGSIRDSLSFLDRILSSSDSGEIDHASVLESLGVIDAQIMTDLSLAVFENNGSAVIDLIGRINDSGMDLKKFYSDLIVHYRNLNVLKLCGEKSPAVNLSDAEKNHLFQLVSRHPAPQISATLQTLLDGESVVRYSSHTQTAIEMVLLKLIRLGSGEQIDRIIDKLDRLAGRIASGNAPLENENIIPDAPKKRTRPVYPAPDQPPNQAPASLARHPVPEAVHEKKTGSEPVSPLPRQSDEPVENNWQGFLKRVETQTPFMFALIKKGRVFENETGKIRVELDNCTSFDQNRIQAKKKELEEDCRAFLNKELVIQINSRTDAPTRNIKKKNEIKAKQAAFNHPFVVEAVKLFDGEIIN